MTPFIIIIVLLLFIVVFAVLINTQESKDKERHILSRFDKLEDFEVTQKIMENDGRQGLAIDEGRNKFCIIRDNNGYVGTEVYEYKELLEVEILEDGSSITKTSRSGQVGGVLLGGILLGGVGAVIGGLSSQKNHIDKVSSLDLRLILNNTSSPIFKLNFLQYDNGIDKNEFLYKDILEQARKWNSLMTVIIKQADALEDDEMKALVEVQKANNSSMSVADEIKKLKDLCDEGILSSEEFREQKNKILN